MNDRLLTMLLHQSWQILLLAVIVAVVTKFIAKNRPHLAHAMWILVLVKCVTPPVWASSFGVFSQLQTLVDDDIQAAAPALRPAEFLPATPIVAAEHQPQIVELYEGVETAIDPLPDFYELSLPQTAITLVEEPAEDAAIEFAAAMPTIEPAITTNARIESGPSLWPQRLLAVVSVGATLTLLIMVVRCVRCLRLIQRHRTTEFDHALNERLRQLAKQLNIRRVPRIIVSNVLLGPAVLGVLRHTIVLPRCLLGRSFLPERTSQPRCDLRPNNVSFRSQADGVHGSGLESDAHPPQNENVFHVPTMSPFDLDRSLVAAGCEVPLGKRDLQFLDPILAHELLHIRRSDLRFGMLQVIAQSLWWFHPAVWFANRWLSREAERCCDEQVIAELGCTPGQYARSLLAVIESKHTLQPIPVFPGMKPVEITTQRMERIMSLKSGLNKRTPLWCWLAVAALAIVVLPGAVAKSLPEETVAKPITDKSEPKQTIEDRVSTNTLKSLITNRQFAGNVFWRDMSLREHLVREKSFWYLLAEVFTADTIPTETKALTEYYRNVGFFDAKVTGKAFFSRDRSEVSLAYTITEGVRYKIREIRFEGNKRITTADLEAELSLKPGDLYDATNLARDFEKLVTLFGPEVGLNPVPHFIEQLGVVDLVFEIDENLQVSKSTSDSSKASGTSAVAAREALREESYDVKNLLEQLAKDEDVVPVVAREQLVSYITREVPEVLENGAMLSSINVTGDRLVAFHSHDGHAQIATCLKRFHRSGFRQVIVLAYFITGPTADLDKLVDDSNALREQFANNSIGNRGAERLPIEQHVISSNAFFRILRGSKETDSVQQEPHRRMACLNGETREMYSGVLPPHFNGDANRQDSCDVERCRTTLKVCPTIVDTDSLSLSCSAQTSVVKEGIVLGESEIPSFNTHTYSSDIEIDRDQTIMIRASLADFANDDMNQSLLVLLKATRYTKCGSTNGIRLADDFIPNSDMDLNADSVLAFVGEKPITVDDLFAGASRLSAGDAFDRFLGPDVSNENRQQLLMKTVVDRLPEYLYDEVIFKQYTDAVSPAQRTAVLEGLAPDFDEVLKNLRRDQGAKNNEELEQRLRQYGFSVGQLRDSFARRQIVVGYSQSLQEGSPLREEEGILEHCRMLLESASRNATTKDSVQEVSSTRASSSEAALRKTQNVAATNPIDQAQKALNSVETLVLSTKANTPWQIMNSVMAFGKDAMIDHNGTKINTLDWIKTGPTFQQDPWPQDEPWFQKTAHGGRAHPYNRPYEFEGHPEQFTAWLAMCKLPLETVFQTPDGAITMQDLIKHAQMTVNAKHEVSWTLLALVSYLPLDAEWTNAAGEEWSIERLVKMETHANMERAPCSGTYRLFSLAVARNVFLKTGKPLSGVWLEADEKINRFVETAKTQQDANGQLSAEYFRNSTERQSFGHSLETRGVLLQFLMAALPDERLKEAWVTAAIEATAKELEKRSSRKIGPAEFYAAASAIRIYLDRVQPAVAQRSNQSHLDQTVADATELISIEDENKESKTVAVVIKDDVADAKPVAIDSPRLVLCAYPVADLVIPILRNNETGVTLPKPTREDSTGENGTTQEAFAVPQPAPLTTERAMSPVWTKEDFAPLVELIKTSVEPESWGDNAVISEVTENMTLVIRQTQKAHDEISNLVIQLRKGQNSNIQITSLLVKLTTDKQLKVTGEYDGFHSLADGMKWSLLTPKRSDALKKELLDQKADVVSSPTILTTSGQAAHVMVGSMDKSVLNGFSMTITPHLVPNSSIIRLQHQISIGTDRQSDAATDVKISASSFEIVTQDRANAGFVMHESLVGSGQTLLLLIERPNPDDAAKSTDRYVLLLTPEHLKEEEEKVLDRDEAEAETESSAKP